MKGFGEKKNSEKRTSGKTRPKQDSQGLVCEAIQQHKKGDISKAENLYKKSLALDGKNMTALIRLASIFRVTGRINEAIELVTCAINISPDSPQLFINLGHLYYDLGDLGEAVIAIKRALEIKDDLLVAHKNLSLILHKLGRFGEATDAMQKAISLDPKNAELRITMGSIMIDATRYKDAELFTKEAIQINPKNPYGYINLALIYQEQSKLDLAIKTTYKAIELNPNLAISYLNLSNFYKQTGDLDKGLKAISKAIELDPSSANAYTSRGAIQQSLGDFDNACGSFESALRIDSKLVKAHFLLTKQSGFREHQKLREELLNLKPSDFNTIKEKIDLCFSQSNIFHAEKEYEASSKLLIEANNLKLNLYKSDAESKIRESLSFFRKSIVHPLETNVNIDMSNAIFIVGMPRSGSTLLESILSVNSNVSDLGEVNILKRAIKEWTSPHDSTVKKSLSMLYNLRRKDIARDYINTTDKQLENYIYLGFIIKQLPKAKIIHCFRNPLDNILSIYRAHFANSNRYSSSILDTTDVLINSHNIMRMYKEWNIGHIYSLNYDSIVLSPENEIKKLISWLGWDWDNAYLTPHLNLRSVNTASAIQVRSPINKKSLGGWRHYRSLLSASFERLSQSGHLQDFDNQPIK